MREMGEKLLLCRGTDAYDKQLNELCLSTEPRPFFGVLHPELLPYVGQNYKKTGILLVGESHYVEKATDEQLRQTDWYHSVLPPDGPYPFNSGEGAQGWFDTREVIVRYMTGCRGRGHTIFSRPVEVLEELGLGTGDKEKDFDHFAFMNFFQRPALSKGESFRPILEGEVLAANEVLEQVVATLNPRAVIFLSKKAYRAFEKTRCPQTPVHAVSHPTCAWWDRRRKNGGCAREDFKALLEKYKGPVV